MEAEAKQEEDFLRQMRDWKNDIPAFAPEALIPRLDALGQQGWELVHMQPIISGGRGDILVHSDGMRYWTNTYFCVFKRPEAS